MFSSRTRSCRFDSAGTAITDAGLAKASQTRLKELGDDKTSPIVAGAAAPAGLPPLPGLGLAGTKITDAGLEHLKSLAGLQWLNLSKTGVTNAGLAKLHPLRNLKVLVLTSAWATPRRSRRPQESDSWSLRSRKVTL